MPGMPTGFQRKKKISMPKSNMRRPALPTGFQRKKKNRNEQTSSNKKNRNEQTSSNKPSRISIIELI
jgi:hypothetical protein